MKKTIWYVIAIIHIIFITSCRMGISSDYYYVQQQNTDEDIQPYEPPSSSGGIGETGIMFKVLEPKGKINEDVLNDYLKQNETVLQNNQEKLGEFYNQLAQIPVVKKTQDSTLSLIDFNTFNFDKKTIQAQFSDKNVPSMIYIENEWLAGNDDKFLAETENIVFVSEGKNTTAGVNPITKVSYYRYKGKNPFYGVEDAYNTATYETASDTKETFMKRFEFYRFIGMGGGVAPLDNMLVAVDTYTGLIFSFGVPTEFISILGNDNPTRWDAVETVLATDGKNHNFYEYDPAGYIDADGKLIMYEWYTKNLGEANASNKQNFIPQFTGVSPYLVNLEVKKPTLTASAEVNGDGDYFTEIKISFADAPNSVGRYDIYRIDDASSERKFIGTVTAGKKEIDYAAIFQDKNAFILKTLPKYIAEAKDAEGNLVAESSDAVEGSRNLTEKEMLLVVMEAIRNAFIDQGLHSMFTSPKTLYSDGGGSFEHTRTGSLFSKFSHTYVVANFATPLVKLTSGGLGYTSDDINNTSINTSNGPTANKAPFDGSIKADFGPSLGGKTVDITINDIEIQNNDKNNPDWISGTISATVDSSTIEYDATKIPFGFYMDFSVFAENIIGVEGVYTQK